MRRAWWLLGGLILIGTIVVAILTRPAPVKPTPQSQTNQLNPVYPTDWQTIGAHKTIKYVALGDSLAAGYYTSAETKSYQYLIANHLRQNLGFKVNLDGFWQAGATISGNALPVITQAIAMQPDLVTIEYGTNEQDQTNPHFATPTQFKTNLTQLITRIQAQLPQVKIFVLTSWKAETANSYAKVAKTVSHTKHVTAVDISSVWQNPANTSTQQTKSWRGHGDGYHPNDRGNQAIANLVNAKIDQQLVPKKLQH